LTDQLEAEIKLIVAAELARLAKEELEKQLGFEPSKDRKEQ